MRVDVLETRCTETNLVASIGYKQKNNKQKYTNVYANTCQFTLIVYE